MRTLKSFQVSHLHIVTKPGGYGGETLPPHEIRHVAPAGTGWKSPVPYLFGGLAAMLGLIAFALLILACSYWKLSGHMDSEETSGDGDGDQKIKGLENSKTSAFDNTILVIMAGENKPTFLATPATSRTTSFGDSDHGNPTCLCSCSSSSSSSSGSDRGGVEEEKR